MSKYSICLNICPCLDCETDESDCVLAKAYKRQLKTDVQNRVDGDAECPNCNHHVYYFQKHCVECGQALRWEVTDERS